MEVSGQLYTPGRFTPAQITTGISLWIIEFKQCIKHFM